MPSSCVELSNIFSPFIMPIWLCKYIFHVIVKLLISLNFSKILAGQPIFFQPVVSTISFYGSCTTHGKDSKTLNIHLGFNILEY